MTPDPVAVTARKRPAAAALVVPGGELNYGELDAAVRRAAGALHSAGVGAGQTVAVWATSEPTSVAALWAIPRLGATCVPINVRLTAGEAAEQVARAGAIAVVAPAGAPDLGVSRVAPSRLEEGEALGVDGGDPSAPHYVVFTSGTSGAARGAILTATNISSSTAAAQRRLGTGSADVWLAVLPLFHVGGLSILWRSALAGGAVVLEPRFDPERTASLLAGGPVTVASLVPTMLKRVLEVNGGPYRSAPKVLVGGGPVPSGLLDRAVRAGLVVLPTYGMTEMASQVTTLGPDDPPAHRRTSGRPLDGVELTIVDESGWPVAAGSSGEIVVGGPMLSPGYVGEAQRKAGVPLATGDLGMLDEDGYLTVLGRRDDVIVTGGENVHPAEVEEVLLAHPTVAEAAVYPVADSEWGSVVGAALVAAPGARVETASVERHARGRLAGFKVPRHWRVVPALPRNELGKVDRDALAAG